MPESRLERPARLLLLGNIPLDLTVRVPRLPTLGEDVRGHDAVTMPGGGFNVLHAARRAGLLGRYAGSHGRGPFGDLVRAGLADLGCEVVLPPLTDRDSGWVVALVDSTGERTFVSSSDAVVPYDTEALDSLRPDPADLVYVSGYSLGLGRLSEPLATWVAGLAGANRLFCDLGPWGAQAASEILRPVLARVDWLSCNAHEATQVSGEADPAQGCRALQRRTGHAVVLVRVGRGGCWVATPEGELDLVAAPDVGVVLDANGAGDTHTGVFLASVARGEPLRAAVGLANAAAATAVTTPGGASWEPVDQHHGSGEGG